MMKTKLMTIVFMYCFISTSAQDSLSVRDTLYLQYISIQDSINDLQNKINGISSEIGFGLSGNSSKSKNLYKINGDLSINCGKYPSEFNVTMKTEFQVKNGDVQENISDLFISYDYNFGVGNGRYLESFAFVNRYSDDYLGIKEKYELGGGILFNHWEENLLTKKGVKNRSIITGFSEYTPDSTLKENWDKKKYKKQISNLNQANIKQFSKLRLAFLIGIFYEIEHVVFADSVLTDNGRIYYNNSFDATTKLNWEFRPTLEINLSDNIGINFRSYMKMPMPWKLTNIIEYENIEDKRTEYNVDIQLSLNFKVTEKMKLGINYRYLYDNAPQRKYVIFENSVNPVLIIPNKKHDRIYLEFTYKFL